MTRRPFFEVFEGQAGDFYWHLKSANSEVVASGEGFTRRSDATRATRAVARTVRRLGRTPRIVQRPRDRKR